MRPLTELDWHKIAIGILFLVIIIMSFNSNANVKINNDFGSIYESQKEESCFDKYDLSFECEYTNAGNFIPLIKDEQKYWICEVNNTVMYEVRAC